jgi:hypothetical protein
LQLSALNFVGNLEGAQIGLINVGKRVRGVQIGLINVADDVDGVPIGLVSVTKTGGVHPAVWSSNTAYANLGVKFATHYTYTMLSGAYHYDGDHNLYGAGFTIGASIPVANKIAADIDLQALHLFSDTGCTPAPPTIGKSYYPRPISAAAAAEGNCVDQSATLNPGYVSATSNSFTSANARAYDQSLGKLRALLRFELLAHLSLFAGTGVTGQVTYPVINGDTEVKFRLFPEFFGGVQL